MDAKDRAEVRSEVFPLSDESTLRHRGTTLSFERRYFREGLRRHPIMVFEGGGLVAHYDAARHDIKIITNGGESYFVEPDSPDDDRGHIPASK